MDATALLDYKIALAIFVGACALLVYYIVRSFSDEECRRENAGNEAENLSSDSQKKDSSYPLSGTGKPKKKVAAESRWSSRGDKQGFSHPWLLTTLKGHESSVLDMEFSSNGKYLASSGNDLDPGGEIIGGGGGGINDEKENDAPSSSEPSPAMKGLSRRQRKNRRREDSSPPDSKKKTSRPKQRNQDLNKKPISNEIPSKLYKNIGLNNRQLYHHLRSYTLAYHQMYGFGYPMESCYSNNMATIYRSGEKNSRSIINYSHNYNNNNNSENSSDSGENLEESEESSSNGSSDQENEKSDVTSDTNIGASIERRCCRCQKGFFILNGEYLTQETCQFHWGKILRRNTHPIYSCCKGVIGSIECSTSKLHVWTGLEEGNNGPFDLYVKTRVRKNTPIDGNFGVYAVDCEMCYTANGLELTRVTVVGLDGHLVYDSFVRPECKIVDYNTRFSGITAKDLKRNTTKTLREVQNDLMGFISADTILVGHSLDNDLRALKLLHFMCIDTSVLFLLFQGMNYKSPLKVLASTYIQRNIQTGSRGHDSYEDAAATMELLLWVTLNWPLHTQYVFPQMNIPKLCA